MMMFMFQIGVLWTNVVGAAFGENWDIFTGLMILSPVLMSVLMIFMPESPYYLITKGKEPQAAKSPLWLRGGGSYNVEPEIKSIKEAVEEEKKIGSISLLELVSVDVYWKPFAIIMMLMFLQQFSGINAVLFYTQTIFADAGSSIEPGKNPLISRPSLAAAP